MHPKINVDHAAQELESWTRVCIWMQNGKELLIRIKADSVGSAPLVHATSASIEFVCDLTKWRVLIKLLQDIQIMRKF